MDTAEKIGLLPGFGWMTGHNFWVTLLICLAITPGMMIMVGLVGESRMIPLSYDKQYLSFFPGDLFLGGMAAGLLILASKLPSQEHIFSSAVFHFPVLCITIGTAIWITVGEYRDPNGYGRRAVLSPTKLYHNIVLYGGYGYLIFMSLIVIVLFTPSIRGWLVVACILPGLVWVALIVLDERAPEHVIEQRKQSAHVNDWEPIWRRWKLNQRR